MTTAADPLASVIPGAVRRRLPAKVRSTQILQAALRVFSEKGFPASRVDDIAAAAGLSKGGIYTHFKSKEEIFEALLRNMLVPLQPIVRPDRPVTVDWLIEWVVNPLYQRLCDPDMVATMRLLVADSVRMPQHVQQWRKAVIDPHIQRVEELVRLGVQQGSLRNSVLAKAPWLVMAPGTHALLMQIIFTETRPHPVEVLRQAHIAMLRELLE